MQRINFYLLIVLSLFALKVVWGQPPAPILHPIDNPNGDRKYKISWDRNFNAKAYWLDMDDNSLFASPNVVYIGTDTTKQFNFQPKKTYFYRVRAKVDTSISDWSNIESTTVTADLLHYIIGIVEWEFQGCRCNLEIYGESGPSSSTSFYYLRENEWGLWVHHWDVEIIYSNSGNKYSGTVECWYRDVTNVGIYYTGIFEFNGGYFGSDAVHTSHTDYPDWVGYNTFEVQPQHLELKQNYPNPFISRTVISYQLPVISDVELSIYNLLGQKVTTLVKERQQLGSYEIEWNANRMKHGIYYCELKTEQSRKVMKMILLRE